MAIMLLEATIPVSSLIYLILGLSGTVALIALAMMLFKAASTLGSVNKLVKDITPGLEETVEQLPAITQNIELISGNLLDMTDDLAETVPEVLGDLETVTGAIGDTVDALSSVVEGVARAIASLFGGGSRKKAASKSRVQDVVGIASLVLSLIRKSKEKGKKKPKKKKA